ncbi:hypothetical protein [Cytobacillus oceanisediminis]|uniref:hypothetical protein n=1 Tax=Cytobacillus oceanisediminis TaxID=665099 RepID=UPI00203B1CB1|nr:hypothetical protein [Cytobacillus oceanisediminis]MCM3392572.1 hypothetical protein [Cytobacillus oceanisediminis]
MTCPIPNTHKRLLEIHRLWHQCLENYFDPEGFRTNLNATIQALRNLTFALQNEKNAIPDFEEWYSIWQDKMRNDEVLSWLNNARVKIVHQKDLETKSIAKVIIKNYLDVAQLELELPPSFPSEVIGSQCVSILSEKFPEQAIKECYAVIERRWTEAKLPSWELLDALAYGFVFLSQLVNEAHEKANCKIDSCPIRDTLHSITKNEILTGKYVCMKMKKELNSQTITLSDFATVTFDFKKVNLDKVTAKKALKRYKIKDIPFNEKEILAYTKKINEMAKKILVKDKYHRQLFMLHFPSIGWKVIDAEVENRTSKFMLMSQIANIVKSDGADAVIHISEAWISNDIEAIANGVEVANTKDRREALSVSVIGKNNLEKSYLTFFKRGLGRRIILGKTEVSENLKDVNFLSPIRRIWNQ